MRFCGECRMCCKLFPVPALDKPEGEWCKFISPAGCTIHDRGRPEICRQYACYWLDHEEIADECRPDRIGVLATESGTVSVAGQVLPICVLNQAEPAACRGPTAQAMMDGLVADGWVLLVVYGPDMHMVYDRRRYAAISEAQIEVAYRYALTQDAEELKSLGAVSADYRALTWAEAEVTIRTSHLEQHHGGAEDTESRAEN